MSQFRPVKGKEIFISDFELSLMSNFHQMSYEKVAVTHCTELSALQTTETRHEANR